MALPDVSSAFVRKLRADLQMSQGEIGRLIEVDCRTWASWENERYKPSRAYRRLLRGLRAMLDTQGRDKLLVVFERDVQALEAWRFKVMQAADKLRYNKTRDTWE